MSLNNCLKKYRTHMNLNQSQLGELIGVSRQTISSIERGNCSPSIVLALKLANVFNVSVGDIFINKSVED